MTTEAATQTATTEATAAPTATIAAPVATTQAATQPGGLSWLPTASPEDVAYAKNKGWDKPEAPADMFRSYQNMEKFVGADKAGRGVVLPGLDADKATLDAFYTKLGRPASADGYKIEVPEGNAPEFGKEYAGIAHELGLTDKQAEGLNKWWNGKAGELTTKAQSDQLFLKSQQTEKLRTEWGAAFDQNRTIADEAAQKFGFGQKEVGALAQALGADGAMKFLHKLGGSTLEGKFVQGEGGRNSGQDGVMTPKQAQEAIKALGTDKDFQKAWMDKNHPDHAKAIEKKAALSRMSQGQR